MILNLFKLTLLFDNGLCKKLSCIIMSFLKRILGLLVLVFVAQDVTSQSWNLPDNRVNDRHNQIDYMVVPRPALSLRGFDNSVSDQYSHTHSTKVYGVRQLLEKLYGNINIYGSGSGSSSYTIDTFDYINKLADENFLTDINDNREENAAILEAIAFMALVTYIIEENNGSGEYLNGLSDPILGLESHSYYRSKLISALTSSRNYLRDVTVDVAFKKQKSILRLTRAWDLYLALENAYEDLGGTVSLLLTSTQKSSMNTKIYNGIKTMWQQCHADVPYVGWATGIQLHEAQAGNWPLICDVALASAAFAINGDQLTFFQSFSDDDGTTIYGPQDIINRGIKSADFKYWDTSNKRYNYWWFQTDAGKGYWAEGTYYFDILLRPVFDFWHVIRSNNIQHSTSTSDIYANGNNDPFNYSKFLEPVEWLADLVSNNGENIPLDDANKRPIESARLFSWGHSYGDTSISKKFAYIRDLDAVAARYNNVTRYNSKTVEISYDHIEKNQGAQYTSVYGNTSSAQLEKTESYLRHYESSGDSHFLLMNGEYGGAISRAEGHEQPDQLQLLYYTKHGNTEISRLMDSGYDSGGPISNSSWNDFEYHNVFHPTGGDALDTPVLALDKKRKTSEHEEVSYNYITEDGNLTILRGSVPVGTFSTYGNGNKLSAEYRRNVIFVKDGSYGEGEYIIDMNSQILPNNYTNPVADNVVNRMRYYTEKNGGFYSTEAYASWNTYYSPYLSGIPNLYSNIRPLSPYVTNADFDIDYQNVQETGSSTTQQVRTNFEFKAYNTREKGVIAFLKVDGSVPASDAIASLSGTDYKTRAYSFKISPTIIDVVVKRIKKDGAGASNSHFNSDYIFDVPRAGGFLLSFEKNQEFGFVRLFKNNGFWEIDEDYNYGFTKEYELQANTTYTISGDVGINKGSTFILGTNTRLVFNGEVNAQGESGNPIKFKSTNPSNSSYNYDRVWFKDDAILKWVIFEGGDHNAYFTNVNFADIDNVTFRNGETGLYSDNSVVNIKYGLITDNSARGIVLNNSSVALNDSKVTNNGARGIDTYSFTGVDIWRSVIQGNGSYGIASSSPSNIYLQNSIVKDNNGHEIYLLSDAGLILNWDYNSIYDPNESYSYSQYKYIYKSILTSQGENNVSPTTYAHGNYWGQSQMSSAMFYGSVQASNNLTYDPNSSLNPSNFPLESNHDDGEQLILRETITSAIASKVKAKNTSEKNREKKLAYKTYFNQYRNNFAGEKNPLNKVSHLRSMRSIIKFENEGLESEKEEYRRLVGLIKRQADNKLIANSLAIESNQTNYSQAAASDSLNEYLLLKSYLEYFEIEDAFLDNKYQQVISKVNQSIKRETNQDLVRSLLFLKLYSLQRLSRHEEALAILELIENQAPDEEIVKGDFEQADFSFLKLDLQDQAGQKDDVQNQNTKQVDPNNIDDTKEENPSDFTLNPSYPNPFNPSTNISFTLPTRSFVQVEIFDINGKLISVLANKQMNQGKHILQFNANNLASGVYIIRARLGTKQFFDKVTLIK